MQKRPTWRIDQGVQRMMETVLRRWAYSVWPIAQQTAAAVVAWVIAVRFAGHPEPFFAPIAAIVGLNATLGRRGSNAVRLLIGVVVGIAVAELVVEFTGGGVLTLALATFFAMLIARAVDNAPIVVAQAAVSAVLITTFGSQEQGLERLLDALIGVGVALVFSQLLFAPEPLRLLRRAEGAVLSSLSEGLQLSADALEQNNHQLADQATRQLRALRDNLVALNTVRAASARIVRHSVTWRMRAAQVALEQERADQLDLLAGSGVMLARTAMATTDQEHSLAPAIRHLATAIADMAPDLGDCAKRQRAAGRALDLASWLIVQRAAVSARPALAAACGAVRMTAIDVRIFAGMEPEQALRTFHPDPDREPPNM
ncbi:MAG TPA: FUSC family protein [Propionibacteriaceae bacterium]|nr:FUSC family protein [Propionibacteriaceae bacterium]